MSDDILPTQSEKIAGPPLTIHLDWFLLLDYYTQDELLELACTLKALLMPKEAPK